MYYSLSNLVKKAVEIREKICGECKSSCYNPKAPALFLPLLPEQKILFVSESPNRFPGCDRTAEMYVHDIETFIESLEKRLKKAGNDYKSRGFKSSIPPVPENLNIFTFIYTVFRPIFRGAENAQQGYSQYFLSQVYWTHLAKKAICSKNKVSAFKACNDALSREFEEIVRIGCKIKLIVIAGSAITKHLLKHSLKDFLPTGNRFPRKEKFLIELIENDDLPRLADLIDYRLHIIFPKEFKSAKIALFPNPSGVCRKYFNKLQNCEMHIWQALIKAVYNTLNELIE